MDNLEHVLDRSEQLLSVGFCLGIWQGGQEFDVADQMGDTELHSDVEVLHVLVIGGEVVAPEHSLELLAEHLDQHL